MNLFAQHYNDQLVQSLLSASLGNLAVIHVLAMSATVQGYLAQNQLAEGDMPRRRHSYSRLFSCINQWKYFRRSGEETMGMFFDQLLQMMRRNLNLYMALEDCQCHPARNDVLLKFLEQALNPDDSTHVEATARILNQPVIVQALSVFTYFIWDKFGKEHVSPYLEAVLQQPVPILTGSNSFSQAAVWAFQGLHVIKIQYSVDPVVEIGVSQLVQNQGAVSVLTMHLQHLIAFYEPAALSSATEENIQDLIREFLARVIGNNIPGKQIKANLKFQQ